MPVSQITFREGGLSYSRLTLGVWRLAEWQLSPSELLAFIHHCLDLGITTFDHADIYGDYTCEERFGAALRQAPSLRPRLQLISKCGIKLVSKNRPAHHIKHYDTSRAHIIASVNHSLQALHTDYLDLLLLHRPDPLMDADETAEAFTRLRQSGKVLEFGVSNFLPAQLDLLASRLAFPLVTNQVEISVMHLDTLTDGTLDQCQRLRMAAMAWSPLGGGELFHGNTPQALRVRRALDAVAQAITQKMGQANKVTLDQVALAWLLRHPAPIVPILGTGNLERLRSAVQAEMLTLSREQWFAIWSASTGADVA